MQILVVEDDTDIRLTLEQNLSEERFVPNDTRLDSATRIALITGRRVSETVPLDFLVRADEVVVVDAPPATKHVTGSNHARVHVRFDARTGRILWTTYSLPDNGGVAGGRAG